MADNIDEEPLENPANTQSQSPPDEIIPIEEIDTTNQNQELKNMEVHHHTHPHGNKNWKSYFWEFLCFSSPCSVDF